MVLVVLDYNRLLEWRILYDWAREMIGSDPHGIGKFKDPRRVRAINWTLQRHWKQAIKEVKE